MSYCSNLHQIMGISKCLGVVFTLSFVTIWLTNLHLATLLVCSSAILVNMKAINVGTYPHEIFIPHVMLNLRKVVFLMRVFPQPLFCTTSVLYLL